MKQIKLIYVDLFCGAGGVSEGIKRNPEALVIACVNHDHNAIQSHKANHNQAVHYVEDIRTLDLTGLKAICKAKQKEYPAAKLVLWASLECTHFSNAKGGQKRDIESRTLAEHLYRYIDDLQPDFIQIENVREFMTWGALKDGKPCEKDKGRLYKKWVSNIQARGYHYDYRLLNAADYDAYTSRTRYFGTFAKNGLSVKWPKAKTHKNAVREVLDLHDQGQSIFERKKPLVENTLRRIYKGLLAAEREFLIGYYGTGHDHSINKPCPTIMTRDRFAIITVNWLVNPQYDLVGRSINRPCFTLIARMDKAPPYLISTTFFKTTKMHELTGSEYTIKIKQFMNKNGIDHIYMRMLNVNELKRIMGFKDDYVLIGSKKDQVKFIGNAVEVNTAYHISKSLSAGINL